MNLIICLNKLFIYIILLIYHWASGWLLGGGGWAGLAYLLPLPASGPAAAKLLFLKIGFTIGPLYRPYPCIAENHSRRVRCHMLANALQSWRSQQWQMGSYHPKSASLFVRFNLLSKSTLAVTRSGALFWENIWGMFWPPLSPCSFCTCRLIIKSRPSSTISISAKKDSNAKHSSPVYAKNTFRTGLSSLFLFWMVFSKRWWPTLSHN